MLENYPRFTIAAFAALFLLEAATWLLYSVQDGMGNVPLLLLVLALLTLLSEVLLLRSALRRAFTEARRAFCALLLYDRYQITSKQRLARMLAQVDGERTDRMREHQMWN